MKNKYFTKEECQHTDTDLPNFMNYDEESNVDELCLNVLDKIREKFGVVICSSIFRSNEVNKKVGGVKTSHHRAQNGYAAADIIKVKNIKLSLVFDFIKTLEFCQLIWEKGNEKEPDWIHVSFNKNDNKKQIIK